MPHGLEDRDLAPAPQRRDEVARPGQSPSRGPEAAVLALQRTAGNAMAVRVLQRARYRSDYSQGCKTVIETTKDDTEAIAVKFSAYRGPGPHAERGDHTTAFVTYKHMVENAVRGNSHVEAENALLDLVVALSGLPGMQAPKAAANAASAFEDARIGIVAAGLSRPRWEQLATAMDAIIVGRNNVPLSAQTHGASTKGGGEGTIAGHLQWGQKQLLNAGDADYVLKAGDLENIWRLLDLRKRPTTGSDPAQTAAVIQQHLNSMLLSYPMLVAAREYKELLDYAFDTLWDEKKKNVYKGFNAEAAAIRAIVEKAMVTDKSAIQYAAAPAPAFTAALPGADAVLY